MSQGVKQNGEEGKRGGRKGQQRAELMYTGGKMINGEPVMNNDHGAGYYLGL